MKNIYGFYHVDSACASVMMLGNPSVNRHTGLYAVSSTQGCRRHLQTSAELP